MVGTAVSIKSSRVKRSVNNTLWRWWKWEREREMWKKYSNLSGLQNHKNRMLPFCWKRRIDFEWFKVFLGKKFKILLCVASGSHVKLAYVRCWNDRVRQQHKDRERYKGGTVVRKRKVSTALTAADILIYTCTYSCWNDQQKRVSKHFSSLVEGDEQPDRPNR